MRIGKDLRVDTASSTLSDVLPRLTVSTVPQPNTPIEGSIAYDVATTGGAIYFADGTVWKRLLDSRDTQIGVLSFAPGVLPTANANGETVVPFTTAYEVGFPPHPSFVSDGTNNGFTIVTTGVYRLMYTINVSNSFLNTTSTSPEVFISRLDIAPGSLSAPFNPARTSPGKCLTNGSFNIVDGAIATPDAFSFATLQGFYTGTLPAGALARVILAIESNAGVGPNVQLQPHIPVFTETFLGTNVPVVGDVFCIFTIEKLD